MPEEAQLYLSHCRFLQTDAGSFIANVQLPGGIPLAEPNLFEDQALTTDDVTERLGDVLDLLTHRVLPPAPETPVAALIDELGDLINLDVLADLRGLLDGSQADQVTFSLESALASASFPSGILSPAKLDRLDVFIETARAKLAADQEIDVIGRIIELRSRRPDRRRNHVGVAAIFENREVFISIRLGKRDYPSAIMAHNNNRPVRVKGAARQLRTQLSITRLDIFEEMPPESPASLGR